MGSQSKNTGRIGEQLALKYLRQKGFQLITKNYYIRGGEIDLIVRKSGILVFVEVKTRKGDSFGGPEEGITKRKRRKLLRAIHHYLREKPEPHWRCDLVGIKIQGRRALVQHFHNIFAE